jgi:hypothetical protein
LEWVLQVIARFFKVKPTEFRKINELTNYVKYDK